jgi:protease-4
MAPSNAPSPVGPVPQTIVVYTQPLWSRLLGWSGWLGFAVCFFLLLSTWALFGDYFDTTGGIEEKFVQGEELATDKVAIISIEGVIVEGDGFVKQQIDRIREDESVKAIVVRVDSPGGTVTGSDYIYHHLTKLRKEKQVPLVVSMGGMAASGGYYVSMAVGDQKEAIFAEPTCSTGSIGVILPHYDLSGLMSRFDVKDDSIASHERKQMLSMTRPLSEEHRQIVQSHIDDMFARFKDVIKEGRPVFQKDEEALEQLATGEIFTSTVALKHGLIDKIGFVEDAIDRAIKLAKLDAKQTRVVKFKRPVTLLDGIGMASVRQQTALDLPQLLDLAAPRAWYLATSLPAIASSRRAD